MERMDGSSEGRRRSLTIWTIIGARVQTLLSTYWAGQMGTKATRFIVAAIEGRQDLS